MTSAVATAPRARPRVSASSLEAVSPGLEGFAEFCSRLLLEGGKPLVLLDFQRKALGDYFSGVRESIIIMPKKNGKSSILAALALHHLLAVDDAEVVVAASSRDQARVLFKQAAEMARRSELTHIFDVKAGIGEIRLVGSDRAGPRIRILAADATTADGVIPTLALVDELHRHQSAELYGVFRDGLVARDGRMVTISTAGGSVESPLGELRAKAQLLPSFYREGRYSYALSEDGSFAFHEWSLDPDDDRTDLELVKQANPAPWQTFEVLRQRLESPSTTPGQWARFTCGLWVDDEEPHVSPEEWDRCSAELPDLRGMECFAGLDLSATTDSTAFVLVFPLGEGKFAVKPRIFLPEAGLSKRIARDRVPYDEWARQGFLTLTPGNVVDYAFVKASILEAAGEYRLREVGYDRWNASQLVTELQDERISLAPVGQGYRDLASPMQDLRRLVLERKLVHGGHPVLRRHILSMAVVHDPAGNAKPAKQRSSGRIDAASALVMALGVAARAPQMRPSAYAGRMCECGDPATPHFKTYHRAAN